jgi:hypothetical protein
MMATLPQTAPHRLPDADHDHGILTSLGRLAQLELELGLSEVRMRLRMIVIAVALAFVAAVASIAAIVVLIAGAIAPLFHAPWQHLVVAGGAILLVALAAIGWSTWQLRSLEWPRLTLTSFEENWRWLGAQLRSRLRLS